MNQNAMIWQHWDLKIDEEQVAWLSCQVMDKRVNVFSQAVLAELELILQHLDSFSLAALVIRSQKKTGFILGADVHELSHLSVDASIRFIEKGQTIFAKIEALQYPTIAWIEGACLGGGLELALACRYRIAVSTRKTQLGLPEVKLGIHPGWGGTVRLPRLIGWPRAFDLMLSGRSISAAIAHSWGLVDCITEAHLALKAVQHYYRTQPKPHRDRSVWQYLSYFSWVRGFFVKKMRTQLLLKAKPEHYPAPFAMINNWEVYAHDATLAYRREVDSIAELMAHSTAKNLLHVFALQERLKRQADGTRTWKRLHIIGAGVMGSDIAAWGCVQGLSVSITDQSLVELGKAGARVASAISQQLRDPLSTARALDRLHLDSTGASARKADVVIEAISEKLEAKQKLFAALETQVAPDALLATNTSSLSVVEIAKHMQNPKRLLGLHFFNPVAKMQLVEVILQDNTEASLEQSAMDFVKSFAKLPLAVKNSPGFLVNRVLMPYLLEAVLLLEEGYTKQNIDAAALHFGMPMGPLALADTVGLDVCLSVAQYLSEPFQLKIPQVLLDYVNENRLGKKTGEGFYNYRHRQHSPAILPKAVENAHPDLVQRLIGRLLNEFVACWRERLVKDEDLLDAGAIFGMGFAPFLGGPLHYLQNHRAEEWLADLNACFERYGERFRPDSAWTQLIAQWKRAQGAK